MVADEGGRQDFDLQPDPRILPMLGEITLKPWQCMAEFIDNAVDGFIQASRSDMAIDNPEVYISIPASTAPNTRITIADNGPGMTSETLEKAMRAGWTGNDPIHNLGMFGMGFNIATARMGTSTTVWTTRSGDEEWRGLKIDFDQLREQGHFRTPILSRPKQDACSSGTEILIEKLKNDQRDWFAKRSNQSQLRKRLGVIYSSMLRENGHPITFQLTVNTTRVRGDRHCIWNEDRSVGGGRLGLTQAYYAIDTRLANRRFCTDCWQWLDTQAATSEGFAVCDPSHNIVDRERRVHGWIGLQRFLSRNDFGIDFLRNGRKLEIKNKDLFTWMGESDSPDVEYPIDDPRNRGRIVGEIHLDHCRVTYMKDRFDRSDPAWNDMVQIIRGAGPLRPDIAKQSGYVENASPLFKMFQAFRRSSPQRKFAGAYERILIVPDNERSENMAKWFREGHSEYQDDLEWWRLVQEADRALLRPDNSQPGGDDEGTLEGFPTDDDSHAADSTNESQQEESVRDEERRPIASLTQDYIDDKTSQRWTIRAFAAKGNPSPESGQIDPWRLQAFAAGFHEFEVDTEHAVFQSETLTPLDALLAELAHLAMDAHRSQRQVEETTYSEILSGLRTRYARSSVLDPVELSSEAGQAFVSVGRSLTRQVNTEDADVLFNDLRESERSAVIQRMAIRNVRNYQHLISEGGFLEYAPRKTIVRFVEEHADLFFDGNYWDDAYMSIDFGH